MTRSAKKCMFATAMVAVIAVAAVVLWKMRAQSGAAPAPVDSSVVAHQVVSNTVEFVKNRVTGGVGVAVAIDSTTKLPMIGAVAIDSPAHAAGLHTGDIITKIGGIATTGMFLKQVVDNLRGFTGASVPVTVLRGTNQISFEIRRASMKSLREKSFNPYE